mmetsp:Transcript_31870/g.91826  ORF Transcript_31870/g.91826 Transcript_31870/m.91826 type:complete len:222 (+) Transcript_31870:144-809(+)
MPRVRAVPRLHDKGLAPGHECRRSLASRGLGGLVADEGMRKDGQVKLLAAEPLGLLHLRELVVAPDQRGVPGLPCVLNAPVHHLVPSVSDAPITEHKLERVDEEVGGDTDVRQAIPMSGADYGAQQVGLDATERLGHGQRLQLPGLGLAVLRIGALGDSPQIRIHGADQRASVAAACDHLADDVEAAGALGRAIHAGARAPPGRPARRLASQPRQCRRQLV